MRLTLYVVPAHLPYLIGLDVIDLYEVPVDSSNDNITGAGGAWSCPLRMNNVHLYYVWQKTSVLYTKAELVKLHEHVFTQL